MIQAQAVTAPPDLLRLSNLTVHHGSAEVLSDLSLSIAPGELFVLLGPSGSGKSTLLRTIGGFLRPSAGRIMLDGVDVTALPPHRRPVNTMFQSYALFPHLTVAANIGFGPRQQGLSRAETQALVTEMLALVRLEGLGNRKPHQLSGGQQQRVALARGLAARPRLLLLDEPLSALDRGLRAETRAELRRINRDTGTGFILVTHDQEEALGMADRIGVMRQGRLEQVGTPRAVYEASANRFVATFIGAANVLDGRITQDGFAVPGIGVIRLAAGPGATPMRDPVAIAIRPERIRIGDGQPAENRVTGTLAERHYAGDAETISVRLANGLVVRARRTLDDQSNQPLPAPGESITLSWPATACITLPD